MTFEELYEIAKKTLGVRKTSRNTEVGNVACALETIDGNVYTGINIDTACSMGFCAEANAIGSMLTNGESKIAKLIAVSLKHDIVPPCGAPPRKFHSWPRNLPRLEARERAH